VNHKRVQRIRRQEGLKVPKKQPKRGRLGRNDGSCVRLRPERKDHVWSYDFVQARTHDGRAIRMLTVLDEYTRECSAILVRRRPRRQCCRPVIRSTVEDDMRRLLLAAILLTVSAGGAWSYGVTAPRRLDRLLSGNGRSGRRFPERRWKHGVEPLCRVGNRKDVPVLHAFYREQFVLWGGPEHRAERRFRGKPEVRQAVLLGLARILDVELPKLGKMDFIKAEREQYAKIRKAMSATGIPER